MSWLSEPWEPHDTHPAVRGINDTTTGRSTVLSGSGDTKHSWQHMVRYRVFSNPHVFFKITVMNREIFDKCGYSAPINSWLCVMTSDVIAAPTWVWFCRRNENSFLFENVLTNFHLPLTRTKGMLARNEWNVFKNWYQIGKSLSMSECKISKPVHLFALSRFRWLKNDPNFVFLVFNMAKSTDFCLFALMNS